MLIEFSVKNFRSVRDEQILSLVATSSGDGEVSHEFDTGVPSVGAKLLPSLVLYGANAAGKSNLLKALDVMQDIVLLSAKESQRGDPLPVTPFMLDASSDDPTMFEAVFVEGGVKYQYGFSATRVKIISEWLFAYPEGRTQKLFEREYDVKEDDYSWKFSSHLRGAKSLWKTSTRSNSLFLSVATQLNSEQLTIVFNWFKDRLRPLVGNGGVNNGYTTQFIATAKGKERVSEFIQSADIGVLDFEVHEQPLSEKFVSILRAVVPEELQDQILKTPQYKVNTKHIKSDGSEIWFPLEDESEGTQNLFACAGPLLDVLQNGRVLVFDELNNSLHPLIVRMIIGLFNNPVTNAKHAQLIFSTHAVSVLSLEVFRRDQIWFAEKNSDGATSAYPLTEFSPRKDAALSKGYLQGRYGAIPFLTHGIIDG